MAGAATGARRKLAPYTPQVATPRVRIEAACQRLGRDEVIRRCAALLCGAEDDVEFIVALGGAPAHRLLASGIPRGQEYWLRVWAARGLLWAGVGAATGELRTALDDDHWRVREMACRVVARQRVADLADEVISLERDGNVRVAQTAGRAVRRVLSPGTTQR